MRIFNGIEWLIINPFVFSDEVGYIKCFETKAYYIEKKAKIDNNVNSISNDLHKKGSDRNNYQEFVTTF